MNRHTRPLPFARRLALLFVLLLGQQSASAQEQTDVCNELQGFLEIADVRGQLKNDIPTIEQKIKDIQEDKLPQAAKAEEDLKQTNDKIKAINDKPTKTDADIKQLNDLTQFKASIESFIGTNTTAFYQAELAKQTNELTAKRGLLRCLDSKISEMRTPEQDFKQQMSLVFAVLIALVIVGFFYLSQLDEKIRQAIFAGQAGIQFLTLFSIVIAIILFGITGILEGKELAALLGGLSGYILGRSNVPDRMPVGGGGQPATPAQTFAARLVSILVAPAAITLSAAAPTQQLTATPEDAQGNTLTAPAGVFQPVWASSNTAVATVDPAGLVTRVGTGTCNITASFNTVTSNACTVTA